MHIKDLYNKLLAHYGPQKWWPGKGYEIAIGAILTQNTSWKNVEIALENLRNEELLNPQSILRCDINKIRRLIMPTGFYNQKAVYLRNLSELWLKNPNPTREELLSIKGIGEETADAISLYLLNKPEFVIDTYTIRISNRLGLGDSTNKLHWKKIYEKSIKKDVSIYKEFHALFVIHAKTYCLKNNPLCSDCFLNFNCNFNINNKKK